MSKKESINNRLTLYNEMYRDMNVPGIPVQQDFIQTQQQNTYNLQNIMLKNTNKTNTSNYYIQKPLTTNSLTNPRPLYIPNMLDRQTLYTSGRDTRHTVNTRLSEIAPFSNARPLPIINFEILDNKPQNTTLDDKKTRFFNNQ